MAKFLRTKIFANYYESIKEINQFYLYYDLIKNNHECLVGKIANIKALDLSTFVITNRFFQPVIEKTEHYDNALHTINEITQNYDLKQINALLNNFQCLNHIENLEVSLADQQMIDQLNMMHTFIKTKLEQIKANKRQNLEINVQLEPVEFIKFTTLDFSLASNKKTNFSFNSYCFSFFIGAISLLLIIIIILVASGVL